MKKLLLLLALSIVFLSNAQLKDMEGLWKLKDREGLLVYTYITLSKDKKTVETLNSSSEALIVNVDEDIVSQNNNEIITEYGFHRLGYSLMTKTFFYKKTLHRVILQSNDTLRYKKY